MVLLPRFIDILRDAFVFLGLSTALRVLRFMELSRILPRLHGSASCSRSSVVLQGISRFFEILKNSESSLKTSSIISCETCILTFELPNWYQLNKKRDGTEFLVRNAVCICCCWEISGTPRPNLPSPPIIFLFFFFLLSAPFVPEEKYLTFDPAPLLPVSDLIEIWIDWIILLLRTKLRLVILHQVLVVWFEQIW